jgi:hypothetical protein
LERVVQEYLVQLEILAELLGLVHLPRLREMVEVVVVLAQVEVHQVEVEEELVLQLEMVEVVVQEQPLAQVQVVEAQVHPRMVEVPPVQLQVQVVQEIPKAVMVHRVSLAHLQLI